MGTDLESLVRQIVREELARAGSRPADEYLTTAESAARAKVTQGTVRRWIAEGRLTTHAAGRVLRVRATELDALMTPGRKRAPRRPTTPVKQKPKSMEDLAAEMFPRCPDATP